MRRRKDNKVNLMVNNTKAKAKKKHSRFFVIASMCVFINIYDINEM